MTRFRKRRIWLVSDYGGEYEDSWESPVRAFASEEMADACAKKRCGRQADEEGLWDYLGTYRKELELVEEVPE